MSGPTAQTTDKPPTEPVEPKLSETKTLSLPSTVLSIAEDTENGTLFCACMDGGIYAVNIASGERGSIRYETLSFATSKRTTSGVGRARFHLIVR